MKHLAIIGLIIALVVASLFLLKDNTDTEPVENAQQTISTDDQVTTDSEEPVQTSSYLDYSEATFTSALPDHRILFFHADWCPDCHYFERVIKDSNFPDGLVILKVDYDSSPDLKQKYEITYQSHLVSVDDQGNLLDSWHTVQTPTLDDVAERIGL